MLKKIMERFEFYRACRATSRLRETLEFAEQALAKHQILIDLRKLTEFNLWEVDILLYVGAPASESSLSD